VGLHKVKAKFRDWLEMEDDKIIDVLFATVIANRAEGDSVNMHIVGPPSSSKSELLRSIFVLPDVFPLSTLTAHTFTSGLTEKSNTLVDHSLLTRLKKQDKTLLCIKDFTSILDKRSEERQEIFAQLREIADGQFCHVYGSGKETVVWEGRLGVITGVTPVIDKQYSLRQILGERFLHYRMSPVDPMEMAKKASKNIGKEVLMRKELSETVSRFMDKFKQPDLTEISMGSITNTMLINLSIVIAEGRSGVSRERYTKILQYIPEVEAPARIMKYFSKIGKSIAMIQNRHFMDRNTYDILKKIARDTLPSYRNLLLGFLYNQYPEKCPISFLSDKLHHPVMTLKNYLEDFIVIGMVEMDDVKNGDIGRPEQIFKLSQRTYEQIKASQIYD